MKLELDLQRITSGDGMGTTWQCKDGRFLIVGDGDTPGRAIEAYAHKLTFIGFKVATVPDRDLTEEQRELKHKYAMLYAKENG